MGMRSQLKNKSQVKAKKTIKKAKLTGVKKRLTAQEKIEMDKQAKRVEKFKKDASRIWAIILDCMKNKKKIFNDDAVYFVECVLNSDLKELKQGLTDTECTKILKKMKFV